MKIKKFIPMALAACACFSLSACGKADKGWNGSYAPSTGDFADGVVMTDGAFEYDGESGESFNYASVVEKDFVDVSENSSSYFSLDRNTASYSQVRRAINGGYEVSPDSVRVEELINYFDYNLPEPESEAVGVSTALGDCPWNGENKLMMTGVRTATESLDGKNGNYVFLIDVSGSMSGDNRIGLAKKGLYKLVDGLGGGDVVSVVIYASGMDVALDGAECGSASDKDKIKTKISKLTASGSTNGQGGLEKAYEVAQKHFITDGNNRIVIISDGDFNVGKSSTDEMLEFIQDKAKSGVYLSVLGVGMGNMRDDMLETLARNGNGNYAYLDNETEAEKVFTHDLSGTLLTVAKDAKAGVTFTENVDKYRLIGYDTKYISKDDFDNENADTGELGSGLSVVALYEIKLKDDADGELATAEVRYKDVRGESEENKSVAATVSTDTQSSDDLRFVSCVAEFGLVIRQSKHKADASLPAVAERLSALASYVESDAYKKEFSALVNKAIQIEKYN